MSRCESPLVSTRWRDIAAQPTVKVASVLGMIASHLVGCIADHCHPREVTRLENLHDPLACMSPDTEGKANRLKLTQAGETARTTTRRGPTENTPITDHQWLMTEGTMTTSLELTDRAPGFPRDR